MESILSEYDLERIIRRRHAIMFDTIVERFSVDGKLPQEAVDRLVAEMMSDGKDNMGRRVVIKILQSKVAQSDTSSQPQSTGIRQVWIDSINKLINVYCTVLLFVQRSSNI